MAKIRVKVNQVSGTHIIEIARDATFQQARLAINVQVPAISQGSWWLSLNKRENAEGSSDDPFFHEIRPGDLLWIMQTEFTPEIPSPTLTNPSTIPPATVPIAPDLHPQSTLHHQSPDATSSHTPPDTHNTQLPTDTEQQHDHQPQVVADTSTYMETSDTHPHQDSNKPPHTDSTITSTVMTPQALAQSASPGTHLFRIWHHLLLADANSQEQHNLSTTDNSDATTMDTPDCDTPQLTAQKSALRALTGGAADSSHAPCFQKLASIALTTVVHASLLDTGFVVADADYADDDATPAQLPAATGAGVYVCTYKLAATPEIGSVTMKSFSLSGQQVVYMSIPTTPSRQRQLILRHTSVHTPTMPSEATAASSSPNEPHTNETTAPGASNDAVGSLQHALHLLQCIPDVHAVYREVRERLALWAMCGLYSSAGLPAPWGVTTLPVDLLLNILSKLGTRDMITVMQTCRDMRNIAESEWQWNERLQTEFKIVAQRAKSETSKDAYKREYLVMQDMKRHDTVGRQNLRRRHPRGPFPQAPGPHAFLVNPMRPMYGAIGGDYDLYGLGVGTRPGVGYGIRPRSGFGNFL